MNQLADKGLRGAKKAIIAVVGGTVVLAGIALLVLPGPGMVVIPLGLAILASEFVWARRLLTKVKGTVREAANKIAGNNGGEKNGGR